MRHDDKRSSHQPRTCHAHHGQLPCLAACPRVVVTHSPTSPYSPVSVAFSTASLVVLSCHSERHRRCFFSSPALQARAKYVAWDCRLCWSWRLLDHRLPLLASSQFPSTNVVDLLLAVFPPEAIERCSLSTGRAGFFVIRCSDWGWSRGGVSDEVSHPAASDLLMIWH